MSFLKSRKAPPFQGLFASAGPNPQDTVDLFKGDWASALPLESVLSGPHKLFEDPRLIWFFDQIGGVSGKSLLELGPLEGGHAWMLERAGAENILSIEGNARAYLKCLVVKELLGMERTRFLYGDFMEYLKGPGDVFDAAVACGVLYHLRNPHELFPLLKSRIRGPVLLWTQYWSPSIPAANPGLARRFTQTREFRLPSGRSLKFHQHQYEASRLGARFWGGTASYSEWMEREDILACAQAVGYRVLSLGFDEPNHINGPALAMILMPE